MNQLEEIAKLAGELAADASVSDEAKAKLQRIGEAANEAMTKLATAKKDIETAAYLLQ